MWKMHLLGIIFLGCCISGTLATGQETVELQLAHSVFFTLDEDTEEAKEQLIEGCVKFLSEHEGTVYFSAGVRAQEMQREVNDQEFGVWLLIIFRDTAAHNKYQDHPRHHKFIEEYEHLWSDVRVFDSLVAAAVAQAPREDRPRGDRPRRQRRGDEVARIPLPDPAAEFAGMIEAEVVSKREGRVVVRVLAVPRQWEHSRAKDAKSLIGKSVVVDVRREDGRPVASLVKFLNRLEIGQKVVLDVAHQRGEALTLLELDEQQRRLVGEDGPPS
jgi:hypothetical protein